jgi:hypothetical protein
MPVEVTRIENEYDSYGHIIGAHEVPADQTEVFPPYQPPEAKPYWTWPRRITFTLTMALFLLTLSMAWGVMT